MSKNTQLSSRRQYVVKLSPPITSFEKKLQLMLKIFLPICPSYDHLWWVTTLSHSPLSQLHLHSHLDPLICNHSSTAPLFLDPNNHSDPLLRLAPLIFLLYVNWKSIPAFIIYHPCVHGTHNSSLLCAFIDHWLIPGLRTPLYSNSISHWWSLYSGTSLIRTIWDQGVLRNQKCPELKTPTTKLNLEGHS